MISYITLNNSTALRDSRITLGNQILEMNGIEFGEYRYSQRKLIIDLGVSGSLASPSTVFTSDSTVISTTNKNLYIAEKTIAHLKSNDTQIAFEKLLIPAGTYSAEVKVWLDTPHSCKTQAPKQLQLTEYSQILQIQIILKDQDSDESQKFPLSSPVYDSYGTLGFFLADLNKMA